VIVVLVVSYTVVSSVQGIAFGAGHEKVGEVAGLFSPYTLVNGVQHLVYDSPRTSPTPPEGAAMGVLYLAATLLTVLGSTGLLVARYRRVSP
jgi:ABC-2 type transport system permease protein